LLISGDPAEAPDPHADAAPRRIRRAVHASTSSRAAREPGISRDTLRQRIDKHGLSAQMPPDFRATR
jgi:transcriptional regulator of acetoin/glycerol metabolism